MYVHAYSTTITLHGSYQGEQSWWGLVIQAGSTLEEMGGEFVCTFETNVAQPHEHTMIRKQVVEMGVYEGL